MWDYTEKVKEHYKNPKNVGSMENPSAVAEVGSISCGDALKLFLKIDDNGIVTDAKFQTFGCGSAVASASALTEMVIGKHIDEVEKITNQDIADALGGLPPQKMHCSVMGHEALEAAVANYKGIDISTKSKVVCQCFGVTEELIREVVHHNKLKSVDEITNFTKAGGACGQCKGEIEKILNEELVKMGEAPIKKKLSKTQMIIKANNVLENYIAEELRKDGGDIELVDIEGDTIYVKLQGACKSCPSSSMTLKNFVENILKEHLGDEITVVEA
jgi:NifU-like protein